MKQFNDYQIVISNRAVFPNLYQVYDFFYLYPGKTFPKFLPSSTFLLLLDVLFLYFNLDCILSLLACTTAAVWQEKFFAF